jgi:signal transduction histidine kinase
MKRSLALLITVGVLGTALMSCSSEQKGAKIATPEGAQAMVAHAVEHTGKHGIDSLIEKVNAGSPEFHDGELYVFVIKKPGRIVAHPVDPSLVGKTAKEIRNPKGKPFIRRLVKQANRNPDGVWVKYHWVHPVTGEAADKSSWLVLKDGHVIGSGVYPKPEKPEKPE